jgi:hypothetical protein
MNDKLKSNIFERLNLNESWVIFFILGLIMMNYPFIHLFNATSLLFGMPLLFVYLYYGWAISIFVIYLFVKAVDHNSTGEHR